MSNSYCGSEPFSCAAIEQGCTLGLVIQIFNGSYDAGIDVFPHSCSYPVKGLLEVYEDMVKEAAYKGLVRPVLDYGSSVWDPPGVVLQEELESVQKRAARFVTGNYDYETGSMTGILGQLKWESLKKRRKDNRLILLYKGLKGKASVPTDDLIPKTRRCRNQHSMAFQTPIANTDVYKGSFFPQTIRDWNALPDSLISSAEDAEDCVAKFTSLVRARD